MSAQIERRQFEQYKRLVKFLGSLMIVLLELALYYYVWMNYYNRNMEVRKLADSGRVPQSAAASAPDVRRIEDRNL